MKKRREEIETRNAADTLAYSAEKIVNEDDGKLPADLKEEVRAKITELRSAIEANDVDRMRAATDDLNQSLQKLGSAVYGQGGEGQPGGGGRPGGGDEGTVEGEFREV